MHSDRAIRATKGRDPYRKVPSIWQNGGSSVSAREGVRQPSATKMKTIKIAASLRRQCQDFHFLLQDPRSPEGFQKGFRRGLRRGFRRVFEGF